MSKEIEAIANRLLAGSEWQPIEAAASNLCDSPGHCGYEGWCNGCKSQARAAVLAYLKALVTEGPSPFMIERIDRLAEDPEFHWETMLKAHIAELEGGND